MAAEPTPPEDRDEPRLSWRDRELLTALRRLAKSQAQVAALEEAMEAQPVGPTPEPGDVERVEALEEELSRLRAKASSRFGGGAARERLPEVEMEQRLVLERLGHDSYDSFVAAGRQPAPNPDAVDPAIVDFARRELEAAEKAYAELLSMPDDVPEAPAADRPRLTKRDFGTEPGDDDDLPTTIDLTREGP